MIETKGNESVVFLKDGNRIKSSADFTYLEEDIAGGVFFWIHPSYLINLYFVSKINLGSDPSVVMSNGSIVPLQKGKQSEVASLFEKHFGKSFHPNTQ